MSRTLVHYLAGYIYVDQKNKGQIKLGFIVRLIMKKRGYTVKYLYQEWWWVLPATTCIAFLREIARAHRGCDLISNHQP